MKITRKILGILLLVVLSCLFTGAYGCKAFAEGLYFTIDGQTTAQAKLRGAASWLNVTSEDEQYNKEKLYVSSKSGIGVTGGTLDNDKGTVFLKFQHTLINNSPQTYINSDADGHSHGAHWRLIAELQVDQSQWPNGYIHGHDGDGTGNVWSPAKFSRYTTLWRDWHRTPLVLDHPVGVLYYYEGGTPAIIKSGENPFKLYGYGDDSHYEINLLVGSEVHLCQGITHNRKFKYFEYDEKYIGPDGQEHTRHIVDDRYSIFIGEGGNGTEASCVSMRYPFNFTTEVTTKMRDTAPVYIGEDTGVHNKVYVREGSDEAYKSTRTPEDTEVRLVQFVVPDNVKSENVGQEDLKGGVTDNPCNIFGVEKTYCNYETQLKKGALDQSQNDQASFEVEAGVKVPEVTPGSKFCTATAINYADGGEDNGKLNGNNYEQIHGDDYYWPDATSDIGNIEKKWNVSNASCRTVAKKPNIHVMKSGAYANGEIKTSIANRTNGIFGSFAEHLAVAKTGAILGFGSGSSLFKGQGDKTTPCNNAPLSIANSDCSSLGNSGIGATNIAQQIIKRYGGKSTAGSIDELHPKAGDSPGVFVADGDITISNNIEIHGSYENIQDIPQAIIISKNGNVKIGAGVSRIDAWIIAPKGNIVTCDGFERVEGLTTDTCKEELDINGVVITGDTKLFRTAGAEAGDNAGKPAERFTLPLSTYLWGYNEATKNNTQASEVYVRELAPRY